MGDPTTQFRTVKKIILIDDLSGHARATREHGDEVMAAFLHQYYSACERIVSSRGGTVIKFIGDACLATFEVDDAVDAVHAAVEIARWVIGAAAEYGIDFKAGSNVHMGQFVEGDFGTGPSKRFDILGRAVNQAFLLGRGPGIRLSEAVYRKLPSDERSPWTKFKPPAVYRIDGTEGILEFGQQSPGENAARW